MILRIRSGRLAVYAVFCNVRGFEGQVIVADVQERKLELAKQFGAITVNLRQQTLIEAVRDLTRRPARGVPDRCLR